jgi:two-component system phosphate regulon sensor histidine kinase PhoR
MTTTQENAFRVLFVDDDKFDQMAFNRLVKQLQLPYDYIIADSLEQAKNILNNHTFDIIITDYYLGDGTGFDIIGLARNTPVVFVTGAGDEEIAVKALKQGAFDYMVKDGGCDHLKLLPQVLKQAVMHKKTAEDLQQYHSSLESLVRQRTDQLTREKELLSVTLAGMTDAVIAVDCEKQIFLFNPVAETLTKYRAAEAQNKPIDIILRLIDEKTKRPVESTIDRAFASGGTQHGTDRDILIARDGAHCPVSTTATPIRNSNGAVIGVVIVLRNVAGQRELDRMKRNLISCVSHELRTPLTSIKSYVATILRDPNMPEQTKLKFLSIIEAESNRLQKLIEGLLELSQIESGAAQFVKQPVAVGALIAQVLQILQPVADKKNIRITADIQTDFGRFSADEGKLCSLLTNLLDNAIKFTPDSGLVSISAKRSNNELIIRVIDTGVGIPSQALPRIFDPFYRVPKPDTQIPGTGLGLAIVKEIVDMHSGRIEVESEPDKGTTFSVYLPFDPQDIPSS